MKKLLLLLLLFGYQIISAQTTTSNIKGSVKDSKNVALAGVNISAVQTSTSSRYSAVSNADGRFNLLNMKVGGSYKVTATAVGLQTIVLEDIYLELGKTFSLDLKMTTDEKELQEVVVNATKNKTFDSGRTGAQTTVGRRELTTLPTISRSAQDFTRLEPSASGGSFAGRSDKYNNYSLNGSVFNNPFGLDAATPGGQTDAQPISLDAIEQIQVAVAPYDVTLSGFTGGSVNAVTKSGTNNLSATAYTFYRNQDLTGDKVKGEKIFVPALQQTQVGLSIGGSIVKDKLFFFANFEMDKRSDLGSNYVANNGDGVTGINESRVLETDLIAVSSALGKLGYNTGAYQGYTHNSNSTKGVLKLDWNINDNNKLSFVTNFLDASKDKNAHPSALGFRGPNASILQFEKSGYQINNQLVSSLLEWNSKFSENVSNKLQIGSTAFNDFRNPFSNPAPIINIKDGAGSNYIIAGHEPFSINNTLSQGVFQATNNLNYIVGNHALTFGASIEKFNFKNSFNLGSFDNFGNPNGYAGTFFSPYFSVNDFLVDAAKPFATSIIKQNLAYAQTANANSNAAGVGNVGGWKLAELNVGQAAAYVQDEWSMTNNFKFTMGFRMDKPLYFDTEDLIKKFVDVAKAGNPFFTRDETFNFFNPNTKKSQKLISTQLPSNAILVSPRVGFNWDINNDKKNQLRGGLGIFTGKFPFVWVGNQVSGADDGFLQIMDPNFKWPQVFRTSLGFDKKFANDMILTIDLSYNNDMNGVHVQNWGLKDPTGRLTGPDNRPVYASADKLGRDAYVMTNANGGYAFNSTVKLQKNFKNGAFVSLAANRLVSKDVNSIEAEITGDAFAFNPTLGDANKAVVSNSKYGDSYRFIGVFSKKFKYGSSDTWATTFSAFGEYARGGRYNYTYGGDINNDGSGVNDLLFIPTTAQIQTMAFTGGQAQRNAYDAFIAQDDYLSANRGQYAERYGALAPWRAKVDVKIIQDYNFKVSSSSDKKNTIQLSVDILNFGNLLNSDWGLTQTPISVQPIGVNVIAGVPTYTFTGQQTKTYNYDASLLSRWQAQFGVRYIF
jgi:Carboxypeptidase regulatory-like domain